MIQTRSTPTFAPQPSLNNAYDVIVLGGGPAGATTAALVAEQGFSVLILERGEAPRFHVGESLIPDTYWTLQRLGLIDQLKTSAFPKKFSVQFINEQGKISAPFYFDEYNPHESSQTWQVERADFDRMLLDRAIELGATLRCNAHVVDVQFTGDQATGVSVKLYDGPDQFTTRQLNARVIVDASGQSAFLASRLNLKRADARLKKATVWTYWKGAYRESTPRDEGATLIISTQEKNSWFWYIPLTDDIVSIGCTGDLGYMFQSGRGTPQEVYEQELARCPGLQPRLANAHRCADYFTTKDFSYLCDRAAGPGYVMVGDAAGFIDPIYSSGVYLALKSGELAADAIVTGLRKNDLSQEQLGGWFENYNRGKQMFHQLVYAFYTKEFNFREFLMAYPQHKNAVTDILVGNVFRAGLEDMFVDMHHMFPATQPQDALVAS